MGIAAGVFLTLGAILNGFAAFAYNAKGKLNAGAANLGEKVTSIVNDSTGEDFSDYRRTGMENKMFAIFLYLSVPTLVVGAVFLFNDQHMEFVVAAGFVAILAEIIGGATSKYGPSNVPGFLGGVLALVVCLPIVIESFQLI